jgi:Beta-propeller repeat
VTNDMTADSAGNVYLTGYTLSQDFPTTEDALQQASGGGINVFISKLNLSDATPAGLVYSTYAGQTGLNVGYAIAIAPNGSIVVGGQSAARNVTTTDSAFQRSFDGGLTDGFILVLK